MGIARTFWGMFLLLGINTAVSAQTIIIDENFSDGDYTNDPTWVDPELKYQINNSNKLQLNAPYETAEAIITTSSNAAYGEWEALVELDFNPSASNLARFYLFSNEEDLQGQLNGYFIQVGDTNDEISLYRQDGDATTKIIDGTNGLLDSTSVRVRIRATRDLNGNWELFADSTGEESYESQGTTTDNTYAKSEYIGFLSDYTSTRSDLFMYDEIKVIRQIPPLAVQEVDLVDNQTIDVIFNLDIDAASTSPSAFSVNNEVGNPNSTSLPSTNIARLKFNQSIPSGSYKLGISNIKDIEGNALEPDTTLSFQLFGSYRSGDLIINEFAYDFPPAVQEEYIEIKNTSEKYLNLAEWQIADNSNVSSLGADPIPIHPDSFLVISADTAALQNVFGQRAYHQASFPPLNNTTPDAVQLIAKDGSIADSLTYSPSWGGTDVALERRSAETPAIYRENWADSPNPDGGTPGSSNAVSQDTMPPDLLALNILSRDTLQLAFDERLNQPGSYDFSDIGISSVHQTAADTIEVTLQNNLENAHEYTLSYKEVEDIFGNSATEKDTTFTFYSPSPADSGDVAINEFMYDPPTGGSEYIELYNHSNKSLNLEGWTLSDNRENFEETIADTPIILPPDSFVVIAPDNTLEFDHPDIFIISMADFPALNNGGDQIIIRGPNATLLDSLEYTSDWGGEKVALERKTQEITANYSENWTDAPDNYGSPGSSNKATPDQNPPSFDTIRAMNENTLELIFSKPLDPQTATQVDNYEVHPEQNIHLISANSDTVSLYLEEHLTSGETYEVTVKSLTDTFGNSISKSSKSLEYLEISSADSTDIIINEVLYTRADGGGPEYVELYNKSTKNIDLSGWLLGDAVGSAEIETDTRLKAGDFLVLTDDNRFASTIENAQVLPSFPSLNDTGDALYIQNDDNITVDSLYYSENWGGGRAGTALERKDPEAASNDANNWASAEENSAGQPNPGYEEDNDPPQIIFSKYVNDNLIEVEFNEFIQPTENLVFTTGGQKLDIKNFDPQNANIIQLKSPSPKQKKQEIEVKAQHLGDVKGNIASSASIPVSHPLHSAQIAINEIMYNPISEPDDDQPDQSEYIELHNTEDHAVSLEGMMLHDAPDENGIVRTLEPVSSHAKWIPAGEMVIVYADEANTFEESQTATFFELSDIPGHNRIRIDRGSLSLASTGDAIFLSDSTGATVDSVFYEESWQNPNLVDTRGIALERIDPAGASNEAANWGSSTEPNGGTPARENSIYQTSSSAPETPGITFDPNPFSPDDDGYDDTLFINYQLDEPDYLIKVTIYDRYGRLVRQLADGRQAGFKGTLQWDGRRDDGSYNRIGIYIVVFEAYNSQNGSDQTFKETVVLARRLN